jgi:hypothetical protein
MNVISRLFLTILIVIPNIGNAGSCDTPVKFIKENTPAYCNGYLYTPEYDATIRFTIEENKYNIKLIDLQNKKIDIMESRIKLYMENEGIYQERILIKEKQEFWFKTIYFLSGALITGAIAAGVANSMR